MLLKKKISNYEEKLNDYNKEIESFRKKEVSVFFIVLMLEFK